jgi:ADP-ribosylglycohydrolase
MHSVNPLQRLRKMKGIAKPFADKLKGSLYGMLVGDAVAVPVHWFYSPENIRKEYGEITGIVAAKPNHAESMVQGMSYTGTIDIMHDKAHYYEGNTIAKMAKMSKEEEDARRDDHGNFIGATANERVHYHRTLLQGQNTANACIARLAMRYLGAANAGGQDKYNPDEFLESLYNYMVSAPPKNAHDDKDQLVNHNDVSHISIVQYQQGRLGALTCCCPYYLTDLFGCVSTRVLHQSLRGQSSEGLCQQPERQLVDWKYRWSGHVRSHDCRLRQ